MLNAFKNNNCNNIFSLVKDYLRLKEREKLYLVNRRIWLVLGLFFIS